MNVGGRQESRRARAPAPPMLASVRVGEVLLPRCSARAYADWLVVERSGQACVLVPLGEVPPLANEVQVRVDDLVLTSVVSGAIRLSRASLLEKGSVRVADLSPADLRRVRRSLAAQPHGAHPTSADPDDARWREDASVDGAALLAAHPPPRQGLWHRSVGWGAGLAAAALVLGTAMALLARHPYRVVESETELEVETASIGSTRDLSTSGPFVMRGGARLGAHLVSPPHAQVERAECYASETRRDQDRPAAAACVGSFWQLSAMSSSAAAWVHVIHATEERNILREESPISLRAGPWAHVSTPEIGAEDEVLWVILEPIPSDEEDTDPRPSIEMARATVRSGGLAHQEVFVAFRFFVGRRL